MTPQIREFLPADYDDVIALWRSTAGVTLRDVDERGPLTAYLDRHRGLSFVAVEGGTIIGAVLCGTDGRRGYLQHLAVASSHRRRGIGRSLAEHVVAMLATRGIDKCHLMVIADNAAAREFWRGIGWIDRDDVRLMSHIASDRSTA